MQDVASLCPITEANLGDGIFPFEAYVAQSGRFGIGSDSNVLLSSWEELRLLEYGLRLQSQKRCVALRPDHKGPIGAWLYRQSLAGGAPICASSTSRPCPDPDHNPPCGRPSGAGH